MVFINTNCLFILCNVLPQAVHSLTKWPHPKNDHIALADAAAVITRKYLSTSTSTVVVVERSLNSNMYHFNKRVLEHILGNLQDSVAIQLYNGQSDNQPWDYHIFVIDSTRAFDEIRWNFPKTYYERDFRFLIVLTKFTAGYFLALDRIFSSCRRFHVINANVILQHPSLGVCMFKYSLFTEDKCHLVQPYLFFRFSDDLNRLTTVFPEKLLNFYGCPLKITARLNPPLLNFSGNKSNPVNENNWKSLSGIDGELIKLLARNLNFAINLLPFPRGKTFFTNYTGFGCFSELLEGRADIGIGGFSASNPRRLVLTVSDVYQISPVIFIIRGERELDPLSRLATPFKQDVWITLTLFLIGSAVMITALRYTSLSVQKFVFGEEFSRPMTNFFAVVLGYPMNRLPLRNFSRYILLVWLLMSLVLRNAYQGSLFDSFRLDKFSQIPKGYNDLMAWNYRIIVSKYFEEMETFPKSATITILDSEHGERLKYIEKKRGRYATVAIRDNFMIYLENNYRNGSKLIMVEETVYLHSAAMFFPKHSIYAAGINKYLRLFNDAGINRYLAKNNAKDNKIFRTDKKGHTPLEPITCFRLLGVFEISGALLIFAVFIFVLELLSVRSKKLQNFINMIS